MSYRVEKRCCQAYGPRASGSTVLETDRLNLVYLKYKTTEVPRPDEIRINLIFAHGTGMNKSFWKYHIEQLYKLSKSSRQGGANGWFLDSVASVDAANHGDSARLNDGKLGTICRWEEGGKDLLQVIKHEQSLEGDFTNDLTSRNIIIGHSSGGHQAIMAGFYDPNLVDSIIPIEAVFFYHESQFDKFVKIFRKISSLIIDEFDSIDDFKEYFYSFSFFKTINPRVLKDFLEDELYTVIDPQSGDIKYKTKSSQINQMSTYLGSSYSLPANVPCLDLLRLPVCHVVAKNGKWNPPDSITYIRNHIPKQYLVKTVDIPVGEHLTNGEFPDETIKIIDDFAKLRINQFKQQILTNDPQVQFNGDRSKIMDYQKESLFEGKFRDGYYPKL